MLVTKHGKEQVIAPLLYQAFGINLTVATKVDTDLFGTFSGEVERAHNQYDTAIIKIDSARQLYPNADLLLASEGSFSPHPEAPVITVNTELIVLKNLQNDVEITAWYKTYNTNVESRKISTAKELVSFATAIDFPDNRIILKYKIEANSKLQAKKGASSINELVTMYDDCKTIAIDGIVEAETDMRACYNTLRMESIRLCAVNLVNAMQSQCYQCGTPGFSVAESKPGLPCEQCGMPTKSILYYLYKCKKCNFTTEKNTP
ncbi:MAG: hypothetical protein M0D57_22145 [Sphingobacteriales bacterium JAD_PAG50586_3]|nr:MAG: hypothetical protein M0D57_22145 [Sphingobacteriales bacterium JAD_PAG50586_3]